MNETTPNGAPKNDAQKLWQSQPLEGTTMSLEEVRRRIDKVRKQVRRRNLIGGGACIVVMIEFTRFMIAFPNLTGRIGAAMTALGAAFIGWQILRVKMVPHGMRALAGETSVAYYRAELQRQHDFHSGVSLWSRLVIFLPGPILFFIGIAQVSPTREIYVIAEVAIFTAVWLWGIQRNLRTARSYQRELDALE